MLTENEEHLDECHCDSFSDSYKDVNGFRPRGIWTCLQVKQWYDEEYVKTDENTWTPRYMLETPCRYKHELTGKLCGGKKEDHGNLLLHKYQYEYDYDRE